MIVLLGVLLGFFLSALVGRALRCIRIYTEIQKISNSSYIRLYRAAFIYLLFGKFFLRGVKFRTHLFFSFAFFLICLFNFLYIGDEFRQLALLLVLFLLLLISIIDYKVKLIPDVLSYSVFWLGAFVQYNQGSERLVDGLCVALVVYISLKSLQQIYLLGLGRDALGDADPLLAFSIGVWLDLQCVPYFFLLSVFVTFFLIFLFPRGRSTLLTMQIPFGPGLASAGFLLMESKFLSF